MALSDKEKDREIKRIPQPEAAVIGEIPDEDDGLEGKLEMARLRFGEVVEGRLGELRAEGMMVSVSSERSKMSERVFVKEILREKGSVRSHEPLALPQNSIGRHCGDIRPENYPVGSVFQTYSIFRDLCRAIRVNPTGLESNDHHNHLRGSLRSREPLALLQNSIGRHRGDVQPENCPVEFVFQTYYVCRDLYKAIRANPIGLEPNDHHSHLWGILGVGSH
ncbi:hypothetical protein CRG98_014134 [Punica granatum]|uniref:Uncharacterized protein n=1 Tax=Punica granatum TaxID=22663 RepID=A0A2I0KCJ7_PUNGR|nr:hypothetical protein CRG98_014134 [Punica granatum]